jgi:DNA-directed RNA polymerase specialized sigma24 family protein
MPAPTCEAEEGVSDGETYEMAPRVLAQPPDVIRALLRYREVVDPRTGSILFLGGGRRYRSDPFHPGFLAGMEERAELVRRLRRIEPRDRLLLFLWYVDGLPVTEIAQRMGISRMQCYRRRDRALKAIMVDGTHAGEPPGPV